MIDMTLIYLVFYLLTVLYIKKAPKMIIRRSRGLAARTTLIDTKKQILI